MSQAQPAFALLFIPSVTHILPENNAYTNAQMEWQLSGA